jgi:hypothetical protein
MIFKGLIWMATELRNIAEHEMFDSESIHRELSETYRLLETRAITEEEFASREERLMERLEAVEENKLAHAARNAPRARARGAA